MHDIKVKFTATFGIESYLSEELVSDKSVLEHALRNIREKVVQEVFGEFREPIHNIVAQLYRREYDKARESLYNLERQMFSV